MIFTYDFHSSTYGKVLFAYSILVEQLVYVVYLVTQTARIVFTLVACLPHTWINFQWGEGMIAKSKVHILNFRNHTVLTWYIQLKFVFDQTIILFWVFLIQNIECHWTFPDYQKLLETCWYTGLETSSL